MSKMTRVTARALQSYVWLSESRERTTEEVSLQSIPENSQWRCWRDMLWKTVQTRAAATGNDRSPMVDSRVRRTISDESEAERRRLRASRSVVRQRSSTIYDGAVRWTQWTSLPLILWSMLVANYFSHQLHWKRSCYWSSFRSSLFRC